MSEVLSRTDSPADVYSPSTAGLVLLPLRLILGWTYFSAFWRRLVLENKLLPDGDGYIGEKFNHFLPNAFLIGPAIEYFVSNPGLLWWKLLAFTLVEAIVGAALMMGFMTRAMGIATSLLALGILLGAGWLGTTCLDEWQIGILGIGSGLAFAWAGGGRYSIDGLIAKRWPSWSVGRNSWLSQLALRDTPRLRYGVLLMAGITFGLTLLTNQVFHGGVWGELHNKSVRPRVEIFDATVKSGQLSMELYRVEGADVYGSFTIEIRVLDEHGNPVVRWGADQLAALPEEAISNRFVAKIKPGAHSLILPLGAKGMITLGDEKLWALNRERYTVELIDVSGARWSAPIHIDL